MSSLRDALEQYLALRRSLGFGLQLPARSLRNFVTFAEGEGASRITTDLALRWAQQSTDVQPATWAWRLAMVRRFAAWRSATDPHTEVPPAGLLPYRYHRRPPHLYTDEQIESLLEAARHLPSARGLRAMTYSTLFGLLAVTGMRVSEGLALDCGDVDLEEGVLTIRRTKFGKSRLVPIHDSTCDVLARYASQRDRLAPVRTTRGFFVSERGTRITGCSARYTFAKISQRIGLRAPAQGAELGRGPRLHDMRHRFAVRTLVAWYRAGLDVEREIPKLATYLGHVDVRDTYWYLEAVPELLELATQRVEHRHQELEP
jgi:integrase